MNKDELIFTLTRNLWTACLRLQGSSLWAEMDAPKVGDWVVENSREFTPGSVGILRQFDKYDRIWWVEANGETYEWANCSFVKIPEPGKGMLERIDENLAALVEQKGGK